MDVVKLFFNSILYGLCPILTKVGTNDLCVKYEKNCEKGFLNVALNFLVNFLKFTSVAPSSLVVLYLTAHFDICIVLQQLHIINGAC